MDVNIIAVDFDGTLCENKWPEIGEPNISLIKYLRTRQADGDRIILWTCRTGDKLINAVNWCASQGLKFDAINRNVKEAIEEFGEDTRKVFANEYIDDKSSCQFNLPFVKREIGITDNTISKLERVFGFSLYDWQKQLAAGFRTNAKKQESHLLSDEDLKSIETFMTKNTSFMEFKEIQAVVKMQYEIYKHLMRPTYIINTYNQRRT